MRSIVNGRLICSPAMPVTTWVVGAGTEVAGAGVGAPQAASRLAKLTSRNVRIIFFMQQSAVAATCTAGHNAEV